MKLSCLRLAAFVTTTAVYVSAYAADFAFTDINIPGAISVRAYGINDAGQMVGRYTDATGVHGYVISGGVMTTLNVPGANATAARGINNLGDIVGQSFDANGISHAFVYHAGTFSSFDAPGSNGSPFGSVAYGINNAGSISGAYSDATDTGFAFVDVAGVFTALDPPGSSFTDGGGINSAGTVVGYYFDATRFRGFRYSNGTYAPVDAPGPNVDTFLFGLNDRGDLVGAFNDAFGVTHAFIDGANGWQTVAIPGAVDSPEIDGINNEGTIVGLYHAADGHIHGFVATPVPEPSSAVLLMVGLLAGGASRWMTRRPGRRSLS